MEWYLRAFRKYAIFEGRARRMEFWMFSLFNLIIGTVLAFMDQVIGYGAEGMGPLSGAYTAVAFLPALAVSARRLHDTGRSGWLLLVGLVPLLGWIVLLVFMVMDGARGANQYGPDPKAEAA